MLKKQRGHLSDIVPHIPERFLLVALKLAEALAINCFLVTGDAERVTARGAQPSYTRVIVNFNSSGITGATSGAGATPLK